MTTPILIAALSRKPRRNPRAIHTKGGRGAAAPGPDNYLAQAPKKKPGAPLGNRHAARGGAERRDRHARLDALVRAVSATADAAITAAKEDGRARALLAALLEQADG